MTLPELAIRRHVTTLMILVSLAVLGSVALMRMPLGFLPELERPRVYVRLPYAFASPEQIKHTVLQPVEDALGSLNGLTTMRSWCDQDSATLRLEFAWSVNMSLARIEIWEKLDRIRRDLPDELEDITVTEDWDTRETDDPILEGRISSKRDLSESYDLLERKIVRPLERISGVAQVRLDGINPREVHINLRLADLELHRLAVQDVYRVLRSSNFDRSLGKVTDANTRYNVRMVGSFTSIDQIKSLTLRSDGLRLKNVADVTYEEPELTYGRHLDGNFAVGITVSAEAKANVVDVCDQIHEHIRRLDSDPDMAGMSFLEYFNQGTEIRRTLKDLLFNGVVGAALATIVLFLFLGRLSTTFVSLLSIPFSLVVTCGFIWLQGRSMNTLTLLGLIVGIGMLVDNAVVVIENIFRHQELGEDQKTAARVGAREVSVAVIAATLTSVIVFLPIVFNKPSKMNLHFQEIGFTVCLTLLVSLFVSQTLIPLATSWFIRPKPRPPRRWMRWLEEHYVRLLAFNLRHRWVTPLVGIVVTTSAIYPYNRVDVTFDRDKKRMYAQVQFDFSEEVTLETKRAVIEQMEAIILPQREALHAKSVYSFWSDRGTMCRIYPIEGYANDAGLAVIRERLKKLIPEIAGIRVDVSEGRSSWRPESGKRVALQLRGESPRVLRELAEEVQRRLETVEGLSDGWINDRSGRQELHVELDRHLATRYGLSTQALAESVGLTFRGRRLSRYRTGDGEREMRLTLDERETESVSQLRNLPVWTPAGDKIPLASVASFRQQEGPERIERHNRRTSLWVGASYEEGTRERYVSEVVQALSTLKLPPEYTWSFGNWRQEHEEASMEFLVNLLLALLLVFAVMASLFESVARAIALMVALPFALTGAIWTLYLFKCDFDQPAAVGLILLIGIVVNNGIVMIEHIRSHERRGLSRTKAMLQGGRERLRPILMTVLTTLLSLIPIVIERPSLGGIYYYSMALVIMGGLALSTFLTSLLLPTTATLIEDGFSLLGRSCARLARIVTRRRADAL